ncbi:MAG: AMP-binding protein [Candidatus Bipolaricaulis sp.]|nr:AMP-binding protein [Candidatus Bipolaricaulis sp.]
MSHLSRFALNKARPDIDRTLRRLIETAYRDVAAYRHAFDEAGVAADEIRGMTDLPKLPILAKEAVARPTSPADVLRRGTDPKRCVRAGTSGSTGLPLNVYMSRAEAVYRRVLLWRAWHRLTPLRLPLTVADVGSWIEGDRAVQTDHRGPVRVVRVSIALPPPEQATIIQRFRPQVISGYPTALDILATEGGAPAWRPSLVACRGEVLDPQTRATLENAFGARVADFYNAEEIGSIAWECPLDPTVLHINTDGCVVEIVDNAGERVSDGLEGRIVVTNLYNETMPFIRYDLNDRGSFLPGCSDACGCGTTAPRLRVVSGRTDDYVVLPDGRRISPRLLATTVNRAFSGLSPLGGFDRHFRRFRITQDRVDHVRIEIVPEPEPGSGLRPGSDFTAIIAPALEKLHPALRCTVDVVAHLDLGPSGKYRKVVSTIAPGDRPS